MDYVEFRTMSAKLGMFVSGKDLLWFFGKVLLVVGAIWVFILLGFSL